jgi:hypothetical protein
MTGTIRWNIALGAAGFLLTLLCSMLNNPVSVSLVRGVYAFAVMFVVGFGFRVVLGLILSDGETRRDGAEPSNAGSRIDAWTPPEEESIRELLKPFNRTEEENDTGFQPLQPPQFVTKMQANPEQLVRAIRHLSEDKGGSDRD